MYFHFVFSERSKGNIYLTNNISNAMLRKKELNFFFKLIKQKMYNHNNNHLMTNLTMQNIKDSDTRLIIIPKHFMHMLIKHSIQRRIYQEKM